MASLILADSKIQAVVSPEFRQYQGTEPLKFVMSLNLARRHLNSSQCAFVALQLERVLAVEAKERQGERNDLKVIVDNNIKEKIPECSKPEPQARDKAAELVGGTNARYVQDAKKIERDAPEVKELVILKTTVRFAELIPKCITWVAKTGAPHCPRFLHGCNSFSIRQFSTKHRS